MHKAPRTCVSHLQLSCKRPRHVCLNNMTHFILVKLKRMYTFNEFPPFCQREPNFVTHYLVICSPSPSKSVSPLKRMCPIGSQFFPFTTLVKRIGRNTVASIPIKWSLFYIFNDKRLSFVSVYKPVTTSITKRTTGTRTALLN